MKHFCWLALLAPLLAAASDRTPLNPAWLVVNPDDLMATVEQERAYLQGRVTPQQWAETALIELEYQANVLGLAPQEITHAIATGEFMPKRRDLDRAFRAMKLPPARPVDEFPGEPVTFWRVRFQRWVERYGDVDNRRCAELEALFDAPYDRQPCKIAGRLLFEQRSVESPPFVAEYNRMRYERYQPWLRAMNIEFYR